VIRNANQGDLADILALNRASVIETSPLEMAQVEGLLAQAAYFGVSADASGVEGFLLALREDARYESPNFIWFRKRFPRFVYIDRIVVRDDRRRGGIASRLYDEVERYAIASEVGLLVCEVNLVPANPASLVFHGKRGFTSVGTLELTSSKTVSLQAKRIPHGAEPVRGGG
jgi:predicted GNAT superfamily acetyltransferase